MPATEPPSFRAEPRHTLVAALFVPLLMGAALGRWIVDDYRLEQRGRETRAEVREVRLDQHGALVLAYHAGGAEQSVLTGAGRGNPDAVELHPGDSVWVTYLPEKPAAAKGGRRPTHVLREAAFTIAVVTVFVTGGLWLMAQLAWINARRRALGGGRGAATPRTGWIWR